MKPKKVLMTDSGGNSIEDSTVLLWGNSAAWLCTECKALVGNRTADKEYITPCTNPDCPAEYEIERALNRGGKSYHLGRAVGVRRTRP